MSDISLQRYKARRAFQSLKEDKHMDNSEYVKLRSVIQNVKETRKDVVEEEAVADPQNFVYVFIVDDTFNESASRATDTSYTPTGVRLITDVVLSSGSSYSSVSPVPMSTYAGNATTEEDMIIKFNADITDDTNFYHYIKVHTDGIGLSGITDTDDLATNIQVAIMASINTAGSLTHDTIIKRVIVGNGTEDIKTAYDAAYGTNSEPTYIQYESTVDGSDHITNVGDIIESINNNAASYMDAYSSSNTIVLYPNSNDVSGGNPGTYDYSGNASIFFRKRMSEQNNDRYTLLYTEWSRVIGIEYAPSGTIYDGVNTLTPATHYRLGEQLAALE